MGLTTNNAKPATGVEPSDETTPLLGVPDTSGIEPSTEQNGTTQAKITTTTTTSDTQDAEEDKPMPYTQILLLCYVAMVEPISYFAIFPIISDMLTKTGHLSKKEIGAWSGLIESTYSIVQMTVMIMYGKLSDKYGRRPVLVFSLFGIAIFSGVFGLAQDLTQMIILRCATGFFAGSSVTIRAMLSEHTTKKTQTRAFSWFMFARNLGIFIGPLIGGGLANPVENFPAFEGNEFFTKFPYALSMFATSGACFLSAFIALFFVKETLQAKVAGATATEPPMSTWKLFTQPDIPQVILIYGWVMLIALMYTAVDPVYMYEPVELGGFNFDPQKIGLFVALAGASQAFWMLGPFTSLQKRFGTGNVLRGCAIFWPLDFLGLLICNELLRSQYETAFWIALLALTFFGAAVSMAFACVQLAINDIAPSPAVLGSLNAIALTVTSAVRSFAPIVATSIYELTVKWGALDGQVFWVLMIALTFVMIVLVFFLPEKAEGRPVKSTPDEEST